MADDFAPGDIAICIDDGPCSGCGEPVPLNAGRHYRVADIAVSEYVGPVVRLRDIPPVVGGHGGWFESHRFRKVPPGEEPVRKRKVTDKAPVRELEPA